MFKLNLNWDLTEFDHGADLDYHMARSDWLGFHRIDNADREWSRPDLALGSTSNG